MILFPRLPRIRISRKEIVLNISPITIIAIVMEVMLGGLNPVPNGNFLSSENLFVHSKKNHTRYKAAKAVLDNNKLHFLKKE